MGRSAPPTSPPEPDSDLPPPSVQGSSATFFAPPTSSPGVAAPSAPADEDAGRTLTHVEAPLAYAVPIAGAVGEEFGRFRLGEELGRGASSRVVESYDATLERAVALKIPLEHPTSTARMDRFHAEARVTSRLQHPNIVPVHDLGRTSEGRPFIVMRKVEGHTLREVLTDLSRGEPGATAYWTTRRLVDVFVQVGRAVAYAHDRGVLHRDLKPDNVMLGRFGEVQVMDWGLARAVGSGPIVDDDEVPTPFSGHTQYGAKLGTPGYMSPEQVRGAHDELDARSDVWSLGSILWELLTLRRAFFGATVEEILAKSTAAPPPTPTPRHPDRPIPDELAAIALQALALDPDARFPSALALVRVVEDWLHGSQRRAQAAERLSEAEAQWDKFRASGEELEQIGDTERRLGERVAPWATGAAKEEIFSLADRREQLETDIATAFARSIAMGERALSVDPGNVDARAFLARAYWFQYEKAEAEQLTGALAFYEERVREYDDGEYTARLDADATLSLRTTPAGAEVVARRVLPHGLVWGLDEPVSLGRTPFVHRRLRPGSYVLTLSHAGYRDVTYPVHLRRGEHWQGRQVPLLTDDEIGADFRYVPAGPCLVGGDPETPRSLPTARTHVDGFLIGEYPVRAREWAEYLTDLARTDPAEAARRAPRQYDGVGAQGRSYWSPPKPGAPWQVPPTDGDRDPWDPDFPVFAVSWHDAKAYAAWRSARDGVTYDLPHEREWEKAARGVDGRPFPWGNRADPTVAKVENSREGRPQPEPVGAFPTDCSVYGVHDLGGGVRDWCGEADFDGDLQRRPVRGGCWSGAMRLSRAANRFGFEPAVTHGYIGLRLVRRLTPESAR